MQSMFEAHVLDIQTSYTAQYFIRTTYCCNEHSIVNIQCAREFCAVNYPSYKLDPKIYATDDITQLYYFQCENNVSTVVKSIHLEKPQSILCHLFIYVMDTKNHGIMFMMRNV